MKNFVRDTFIALALAAVVFVGLQTVIDSRFVASSSMEPSLETDQRLFASKFAYAFHEPNRGDIIVFRHPNRPPDAIPLIKRIIGLPGETIMIKKGMVFINDEPLDEPYVKEPPRYTMSRMVIPDEEYFVLGDNRNASADSHTGWTVPREYIIGKAWLSTWPPSSWDILSPVTYGTN